MSRYLARAGGTFEETLWGLEVGTWSMEPGTDRDTEADEVFVVLSGAGTIEFASGEVADLAQGDVVRLHAGERTLWTVTETLRKIYLTPTQE